MKKPSVLLVAVLALVVAESALAADLPARGALALPPLPTAVPVNLPPVVAPILPSAPALPNLPALPSLPALPNLPAVPQLPGGTNAPTLPNVTGLSAVPGRSPSAATGGSKPAAGAVSGRPSSSPSAAGTGSSAAAGGTGARSGAGGTRRAVARVRRERRLRTTIRRLQDCLGGLSRLERRVLVLRAGIGAGPARSRARVARRLDVSVRRVARTERRGLRTLHGLARAGRCGAAEAAGGQAAAGVPTGYSDRQGQLASAPRDRSDVRGEQDASGGAPSPSETESQGLMARPPAVIAGGVDLTLPLLMLLAIGPVVLAARAARRNLTADPPA
jgi:hypothetical protein